MHEPKYQRPCSNVTAKAAFIRCIIISFIRPPHLHVDKYQTFEIKIQSDAAFPVVRAVIFLLST
jgi:hypothetical protein